MAQVAFQFKQFAKFTTFFLVRNGMEALKGETSEIRADARKRLIGAVGMTGLAAGVTGIPLYGAVMAAASIAANMMKGDDEPPVDADMEFRKFLYELTGSKLLTRAITSGPISVATDIDLHSRLSLNDLWFRDPKQTVDEEEAARNFLIQMMGPSAGLVLNAARGYKLMNTGDFERGVEAMLPAILRNLFVAGRYATEGAKTLKGDVLLEQEKISAGDVLWQGIGFSPSRLADLQQMNIKLVGKTLAIMQEKTRLMQQLYDEISSGGEGDTSKVLEQIMDFNRKYPGAAITADSIRQSMKARAKAQAKSIYGARIPDKLVPFISPYGEYARPD